MIIKLCIVLPTYNNPDTVYDVARNVLSETPYQVLIVDDGSTTPIVWDKDFPSERVKILRLSQNKGKGVAIQAAIKECSEAGFTHILTMDADGQHLSSEISKLTALAKKYPWDIIIGNRRLQSSTVPGISKFGRAFSNFWVNFQTGTPIKDSQSGFRLYPLFPLQNMRFWCKRYDFEIEVLIRLLWKNVHIHETEIEVFYPDKEKRVSHFNKLWDNVRISLLNTLLVIMSLFNSHKSPLQSSLALGIGAFVGCTPFFGFHALIVGFLAFIFRLNAFYMFLGSQVSIPPLIPFIVFGSMKLGDHMLPLAGEDPLSLSTLANMSFRQIVTYANVHGTQWLVGSLVLGAIVGSFVAVSSYLLGWIIRKRKQQHRNWNGNSRGGAFGNGFLKLVLRFLGLRAGYFCLLFIIPYFYIFAPQGRKALNEYWKIISPTSHFFNRQWKIMKHFFRFGQVLMDRVYNQYNVGRFKTQSEGIENIRTALELHPGLTLMTGHVGGWELATSLIHIHSRSKSVFVAKFDKQAKTIFDIYQQLQNGGILAIMADRPVGERYELVQFFGKLAPFDITPFRIAVASKTPILFAYGFKAENDTYHFFASEANTYQFNPGIDQNLQCRAWAQQFASDLERKIKAYPDQWFNFYSFWSSLPTSPTSGKSQPTQNHLEEELHKRTTLGSA